MPDRCWPYRATWRLPGVPMATLLQTSQCNSPEPLIDNKAQNKYVFFTFFWLFCIVHQWIAVGTKAFSWYIGPRIGVTTCEYIWMTEMMYQSVLRAACPTWTNPDLAQIWLHIDLERSVYGVSQVPWSYCKTFIQVCPSLELVCSHGFHSNRHK